MVFVVDETGESLGRMRYDIASRTALDRGLDLVQVGQNNSTSVFKIMDQGKWKYQQSKLNKKKKNKTPQPKEIRFRVRIENYDLETKIKHIKKFLSKRYQVKISVEMHGRERNSPQVAREKLEQILSCLGNMRGDEIKSSRTSVSILIQPKPVK